MRYAFVIAAVLLTGAAVAQEREVPRDSERVYIPGCAKGRTFTVAEPPEHEPVRSPVEPGRRFRMSGPKKVLDEIKARELSMLEITGLVRKAHLNDFGGVSIAGGRVRIGGGVPQAGINGDPRRDPLYNEVVIDVESWRALPEECPKR
jgi:hypothetical protein